jgi:Fur family ferric uptake transcriptional regulator
MNFSSVYRTIELFCQEGVLTLVDATSEGKRFVLSDKHREHCHFLTCQKCEKILSFKDCFIHEIEEKIGQKFNFKITSHDLKLSGYCERCI